nr:immunoglobulin light chain junction region [Macaca mulatta]
CQHGHAMPFTF